MASGGYRPPGNTTDFLEEWKAKREKMRARFAAATGASNAETGSNRNGAAPSLGELNNNGGDQPVLPPWRAAVPTPAPAPSPAPVPVHPPVPTPVSVSVSVPVPVPAPRRGEEEDGRSSEGAARNSPADGAEAETPPPAAAAADTASSSPPPCAKGKEKKCSGPSARKGKGQIEKRKLREKRRSTGVVNIPAVECLMTDEKKLFLNLEVCAFQSYVTTFQQLTCNLQVLRIIESVSILKVRCPGDAPELQGSARPSDVVGVLCCSVPLQVVFDPRARPRGAASDLIEPQALQGLQGPTPPTP
ncbi:PRKC apoptosis WT1 regulator protein isoform X2 [Amblyraja radiata]|uniref:PRKC apoptosis WT1 regulator protein isoform X2 n=1 Tax=Amblyraja radiata TaxID=386614 RepID=UPI001401D88A|nr:PRKC apoptosis WT1 regulator protein isoform X2 [Amblyraja radiata]